MNSTFCCSPVLFFKHCFMKQLFRVMFIVASRQKKKKKGQNRKKEKKDICKELYMYFLFHTSKVYLKRTRKSCKSGVKLKEVWQLVYRTIGMWLFIYLIQFLTVSCVHDISKNIGTKVTDLLPLCMHPCTFWLLHKPMFAN